MKAREIRELSDEELRQRAEDLGREMFDLRIQKAVGQNERPLLMRSLRRDMARLKTVAAQRKQS
ncbi:MAG: 50S ribosomal protein L29 [Lentisphaerales bacterium]|jgi:large subunit ribosomal protein L29|nr:MAG: 50S ribosomal protein L29 [Lentisphaerales bacterium]